MIAVNPDGFDAFLVGGILGGSVTMAILPRVAVGYTAAFIVILAVRNTIYRDITKTSEKGDN